MVECAWTAIDEPPASSSRAERLILPDGCVDVIADLRRARIFAVGTMTTAQTVVRWLPAELVAVRFRPGGAVPFLGVPMTELTDRIVELGELRDDAVAILEAVQADRGEAAAVTLQRELASRPRLGPRADERWLAALAMLQATPVAGVGELSDRLGVSRQHLTRRCKELAGIGPKRLARVSRFRRLMALVDRAETRGWADAANAAGYYDQAHMIAEVRGFTGLTPGRLDRKA